MRYKVLFISSWFPSKIDFTNGNFVQRHAEAVALRHDVEVLHAIGDNHQNPTFLFDDQVINGIRTLIIYYRNTKNPLLNFYRRMKAYRMGFSRMNRPDIVHANVLHNSMLFAVFLKNNFRIPFVVSEHWSAFQKVNRVHLTKQISFTAKIISTQASMIMPVSENLKIGLLDLGIKTPMKVVGNVVDTDVFNIENHGREKFTFLHISNLIALKNPDKIIAAAVKLHSMNPNFELHIGGDGDINLLNNLVKKYQAEDYIKVFGAIPHTEVAAKMKKADCFILFSSYENLPCVLLESCACGVPVIASNVGGIPEIVSPENGILIDKGEEQQLLFDMQKMLVKDTQFEKTTVRSTVSNRFSKEKIADMFTEIYKAVLQ